MNELTIHISNRRIVNVKEFKEFFQGMKDGKHILTAKDARRRSLPQNAYYWKVIVPMVFKGLIAIGFDEVASVDEAHDIIKLTHLRKRMVNENTGEVIDIAGSTKNLTVPEFNEFIERVCKWAAEYLDIVIPSPSQQFEDFSNHIDNTIKHIDNVQAGQYFRTN